MHSKIDKIGDFHFARQHATGVRCRFGRLDNQTAINSGTIRIRPVGYAGTTSEGEVDFKLLLSEPQPIALSAFEKLYATGNAQGKLYALAGIKRLNPKQFKELLATAKASQREVIVMRGCIISHEAFRDVATQIDEGRWPIPRA